MKISINSTVFLSELTLDHAASISILVNQNRQDLEAVFPWAKTLHTRDDAKAYITDRIGDPNQCNKWFMITVDGKQSGVFGIKSIDHEHRTAELGYWLCSEARGQGVTNRIIKSLSRYLAASHLIETIEFRCLERNLAGLGVIKKTGAQLVDAVPNEMDIIHPEQNINVYHLAIT